MADLLAAADLMQFLSASPTPYHAVAEMAARLRRAGFTELREADAWATAPGGRYFVTRAGASLVAFCTGRHAAVDTGWRMVGAHTDSPCLKLKPQPVRRKHGYMQLAVEVYGGALLNPWFDRDLSLAGKVSYLKRDGTVLSTLVDFREPLGTIPSLAIHLDREANNQKNVNAQLQLPVVMATEQCGAELGDIRAWLAQRLQATQPELDLQQVLDFELSFYDCQPPALVGLKREFIAGARLDNLLSCAVGLAAITTCSGEYPALLVCNDHEEVGSVSHAGAQGPFLRSVLQRLHGSVEELTRALDRSLFVSADNAHALHPNFADKYDDNHGPRMGGGPVIKVNASQRYATSSETAALFRQVCVECAVPVQSFVVRSDMACGSTIGPLTAAEIGVRAIDVGIPQLAMHSIREQAGIADVLALARVLQALYQRPRLWQ